MKLIPAIISLSLSSFALGEVLEDAEIKPPKEDEIICRFPIRHPVPDPKPETEAIPKAHAGLEKIAIVLEKIEQQQAFLGMQITLRIINPTDKAMIYQGAYASAPEIKRQRLTKGKWVDQAGGIKPGFNTQAITLPPGQSVVFVMGVTAEQMPARIGIDYSHGGKAQFTAWSDKIER